MTLIVAAQTKEGLVVCADKREYNELRGGTDDQTKIVQLGPRAAFAHSGAARICRRTDLTVLYDVAAEVRTFFVHKDLEFLDQYLQQLASHLELSYESYLAKGNPGWQRTGLLPGDALYVLYFFNLERSGHLRAARIKAEFKEPSADVIGAASEDLTELLHRSPLVDGQVEVVTEIVRGQDARFNDLRSDALVKRVWLNTNPVENPTSEVLEFARKLIRWTSECHSWISTTPCLVSTDCDCAMLSYKDGFKWLG